MTENTSTTHVAGLLKSLEQALAGLGPCAVAVSGGVDSMTLAVVAHRSLGAGRVTMFHAQSAAVPPEATARVKAYADREGWQLRTIDAREIEDPRYVANPANRCYFCKTNLYGTISGLTTEQLLSGTNRDDLGDFRPGLSAAREHAVKHPYVESAVDKNGVRAIARYLGLDDLSELPAAPCLSSRVETGISIDPASLVAIHAAERLLAAELTPETVRCRLRSEGVVIELDAASLQRLQASAAEVRDGLISRIGAPFSGSPSVQFTTYQRGSAFLRETLSGKFDGHRTAGTEALSSGK